LGRRFSDAGCRSAWLASCVPASENLHGATVTAMVVKGLIERDAGGEFTLTKEGRAVLAELLMVEDE